MVTRSVASRALLLALLAASAHAVPFTFVDLGPAGFEVSWATGVSGGQQVGYGRGPATGGNHHALLWTGTAGSVVDLHPAGFAYSQAGAVSGGQQVGFGLGPPTGDYHALLWTGTAESVVDLNPAGFAWSEAMGVSGGQQAGFGGGPAMGGDYHALLWTGTAESVVDLNPAGFYSSLADGVSGGQQVGSGWGPATGGGHALLWTGMAESVVDLHPVGFDDSAANGVSGGQQVGYGWGPAMVGVHALLWTGTAESVVDLHPVGFGGSVAYGVSGGQQVGFGAPATVWSHHALLWTGTAESVVDLHAYVPAGSVWSEAYGIDEAGNVVGFVTDAYGRTNAAMWVPAAAPPANRILDGVPQYLWNYGCSPTAGGVLIGYWDQPGRLPGLVAGEMPLSDAGGRDGDGDALHDAAPANRAGRAGPRQPGSYNLVDRVIASEGHIRDYWMGDDDGYDDRGPTGDPFLIFGWDRHQDDCIADFMEASRNYSLGGLLLLNRKDGWAWPDKIGSGLVEYARWSSGIAFGKGYLEGNSADLLEEVKRQISNECPAIVNIYWDKAGTRVGHSFVAYGWLEDSEGTWVAARDAWEPGLLDWPTDTKWWNGHEMWKWDNANYRVGSIVTFYPLSGCPANTLFLEMAFDRQASEVWGLGAYVDPGSGAGTAEIVNSPLGADNDVLRLSQPDPGSFVAIEFETSVAELTGFSFDYLFDSQGKFRVTLDNRLLIELACLGSGPGSEGADDFASFFGVFSMSNLGLDANEMHTWRIELSAFGDPVAYIDSIRAWNAVPEPATVLLFACSVLAMVKLNRRKKMP
jgi:hypothetical protein